MTLSTKVAGELYLEHEREIGRAWEAHQGALESAREAERDQLLGLIAISETDAYNLLVSLLDDDECRRVLDKHREAVLEAKKALDKELSALKEAEFAARLKLRVTEYNAESFRRAHGSMHGSIR